MVKTFKDHIRLESILVGLCHIRACGGTDPLNNPFINARSQMGHWDRLLTYVIKKVAHPGHLLNAPDPPDGCFPIYIEVA